MPTQTVTEPPEEEMPDADESRKDEEGNVMTYEQVLLKCANDEDLARDSWDMMVRVEGTPPPSPATQLADQFGNLPTQQQQMEQRNQKQAAAAAAAKKADDY